MAIPAIKHAAATGNRVMNVRPTVALLWNSKRWISVWVLVGIAFAALPAFLTTPVYQVETVLVAASNDRAGVGNALGSTLGSLGGLASLAGFAMGSAMIETEESLAVLRSREFSERFINDNHLLPEFYPTLWDAKTATWKTDVTQPPTLSQASKYLDSLRMITKDKLTGLTTLQFEWHDPEKAARWANDMVDRLNLEMRSRAIISSSSAISYLQNELTATTVVETRGAISRLLEAQINKRMMANVTLQYAFRVVDRASIPDRRDKIRPKRAFLLMAGATVGFVLSILLLIAFAPTASQADTPPSP